MKEGLHLRLVFDKLFEKVFVLRKDYYGRIGNTDS